MGFLPARMTRLLIGGHQSLMPQAIAALHAEGAVHLEDYQDASGATTIGTPLANGEHLSATLVRLRGLQKALGAEASAVNGHAVTDLNVLQRAESASSSALSQVATLRAELAAAQAAQQALAPLAGLDVDTSLVGALKTVKVTMGSARRDPSSAFRQAGLTGEIQALPAPGGLGFAVAVAVPQKEAAQADRILAEAGFALAALPSGKGTPTQRLADLVNESKRLQAALEQADAQVAALRAEWAGKLASLEQHLSAEVEKSQAPLRFGVTATTFHVEGWVPRDSAAAITQKLGTQFGDRLYVHELGDAPRSADGHAHDGHDHSHEGHDHSHEGHGHDGHDHTHASHDHSHDGHAAHANVAGHDKHDVAAHEGDNHHSDPKDEAPVALANPKAAHPYEWILGLLNRPLYNEVDPSKLMMVFFPLFFGLMVGDVVTGLLITLFGAWLRKNKFIGIGGPAVGKALMAGGIVAMLMGTFVFGEALGVHFFLGAEEAKHELSWSTLLHWTPAATGLLHLGHAGEGLLPTGVFAPHADEHLMLGSIPLGIYSKLEDVQALMVVALVLAAIHILLGIFIGFRNVMAAHGTTLAVQEKLSLVLMLAGIGIAVGGGLGGATMALYLGVAMAVAAWVLLIMGLMKVHGSFLTAIIVAVIEPLELGANFVSYTRLAAIGAAEAGLGLAAATICFPGGPHATNAVGWVVYCIAFAALTLLSILSGGLQSLRLQFVEFFGKFFGGGGRPYVPFGRRAT